MGSCVQTLDLQPDTSLTVTAGQTKFTTTHPRFLSSAENMSKRADAGTEQWHLCTLLMSGGWEQQLYQTARCSFAGAMQLPWTCHEAEQASDRTLGVELHVLFLRQRNTLRRSCYRKTLTSTFWLVFSFSYPTLTLIYSLGFKYGKL